MQDDERRKQADRSGGIILLFSRSSNRRRTMSKTIRRILMSIPVLALLGFMAAAPAARADDLPQDVNSFWQAMASPTPPCPPDPAQDDVNTYWQKVQLQQEYQELHQRNQYEKHY
jgi:hypothetical protein